MAADITSSGVISSPCAARSPSSRALKSMAGKEAPGRPSMRERDFSTWDRRFKKEKKKEEEKIKGARVHNRREKRETNRLLKLFIQSHTWVVVLNMIPLVIFPRDSEACGMYKVLLKPSQLYVWIKAAPWQSDRQTLGERRRNTWGAVLRDGEGEKRLCQREYKTKCKLFF